MWRQIKNIIRVIVISFVINSCKKENSGKFIFYQGETPITIKDYDIYSSNLDNIYLVIKDFNRRSYVVNNNIDSMHYKVNDKVYKAELNKISGKFSKFHLITQNDGNKLFINGFNKYHQELLYLGLKNDLDFIVTNNEVLIQED